MNIAPVTGLAGVAVSFTFDQTIANIGATTDVHLGTVTSTCSPPTVNLLEAGRATITLACTTPVTSSGGTLFNITFTGVANGVTPLTFSATANIPNGCILNEGTPGCESSNGQITVGPPQPTATNTAAATATATATVGLTATSSATATVGLTATSSATATVGLTATSSATATNAATGTPTATRTNTATPTNTATTGPSATPTQTLTPSSTPTATLTRTVTATASVTSTASVTQTPSATLTPSNTATVTATGTVTDTPTATRTRPGIPVIPSPTSPAGLVMVVGLGMALIWALRRLQRPQ